MKAVVTIQVFDSATNRPEDSKVYAFITEKQRHELLTEQGWITPDFWRFLETNHPSIFEELMETDYYKVNYDLKYEDDIIILF